MILSDSTLRSLPRCPINGVHFSFPRRFGHSHKKTILDICATANVSTIAEQCRFPDWLGYLGLVLAHMQCEQDAYLNVSARWAGQLRNIVEQGSSIHNRLQQVSSCSDKMLNIQDLENVELAIRAI